MTSENQTEEPADGKESSGTAEPPVKKRKGCANLLFRLFLAFMALAVIVTAFAGLAGYLIYQHYSKDLPKISSLEDYRPPIITTVYSDDNQKIGEFFKERRIVKPISEIPQNLINAFVAAEDSRFFEHKGIDLFSIARAFFRNLQAGEVVQGGSTITQQVIKSFLLSPERKYRRKIREAILAYRIDKAFTKEQILYLYLNQIYLGHGAYGVEAAAENYFGKSSNDLSLAECAMLAGLPQAPSDYSPYRHPEMAKKRQIYVLNRMLQENMISPKEADNAKMAEIEIKPRKNIYIEQVPDYTEYVRRYVEKKYGRAALYNEGLKIYAAVDIKLQEAAGEAILRGVKELDKRQGYRGPLEHLEMEEIEPFSKTVEESLKNQSLETGRMVKGVVIKVDDAKKRVIVRIGDIKGTIPFKDMTWARKPNPEIPYNRGRISRPSQALTEGDVVLVKVGEKMEKRDQFWLSLEQEPEVQSALLSMEADTGHVKAMVGGRDFRESQYNRAIQAKRQPGSAFKPIIYAAAIDKGYTASSIIIDNAIVMEDIERDITWKPKSYDRKFHGPTRLRVALAKSRNLASIKVLSDIGVDYAIGYARKLGITSHLERNLSIALGSSGVSLLELVRAYSVFQNSGYLVEPVFITKIVDRDGVIIEEAAYDRKQVIEASTAYIMTSLLESVVQDGTGARAKVLRRPLAGKTGTTNNLYDAWFMGYSPRYITGVWVGFDESKSLGERETGSGAACPIWIDFMKTLLDDKPIHFFKPPEGIVYAKIDADTGLLPNPETQNTIFECFKEGTVPTEQSRQTGPNIFKDDF